MLFHRLFNCLKLQFNNFRFSIRTRILGHGDPVWRFKLLKRWNSFVISSTNFSLSTLEIFLLRFCLPTPCLSFNMFLCEVITLGLLEHEFSQLYECILFKSGLKVCEDAFSFLIGSSPFDKRWYTTSIARCSIWQCYNLIKILPTFHQQYFFFHGNAIFVTTILLIKNSRRIIHIRSEIARIIISLLYSK